MHNLAPFLSVDQLRRDLIRAQTEWNRLPPGDPMRGIIAAGCGAYRAELEARAIAAGDTVADRAWKTLQRSGWA